MWSVLAENLYLAAAAVLIGALTGWWALKRPSDGGNDSGDRQS